MSSYLILHGLGGSGPHHWQTWLSHELAERNYHVSYPTFSNFDAPNKEIWLEELTSAWQEIPEKDNLIVVTHSLGCLLWLHFSASQRIRIAKKAILVAPPSPAGVLPEAKSFFPVPLGRNELKRAADETLFVHSSNDHYCSMKDVTNYMNLGFSTITLPNMGHINTDSGHGKWPWILEQCLSAVEKSVNVQ